MSRRILRTNIENYIPTLEASANIATTVLEQSSIFGIAAAVSLMKGIYSISTGAYKELYKSNLQKLERMQSILVLIDNQLKTEELCVNYEVIQSDVTDLLKFLTQNLKGKLFVTVFNSNSVSNTINNLITKLLFSYNELVSEVTLISLYLASKKAHTPSIESWISSYKFKCIQRKSKKNSKQ